MPEKFRLDLGGTVICLEIFNQIHVIRGNSAGESFFWVEKGSNTFKGVI